MSEARQFANHHLPRPCKFCGQGAGYAPLPELDKHGVDVYFCHSCQAEYVYWDRSASNDKYTSMSLYTDIGGELYRLTMHSNNTSVLWYIKDPGVPATRANKNLEMVKNFNYVPEVTPQNFNERLRTWLVFI